MEDVVLIEIDVDGFEDFYKLKCEEENIYWTNYEKMPDKKQLLNWYKSQIKKNDRKFFLAKKKNYETIGYGYIDILDEKLRTVEISYGISSKFKGQSYGKRLVKSLVKYVEEFFKDIDIVIAWVFQDNEKSKSCLKKNEFSLTLEKKEVYFVQENKFKFMEKYKYYIR